MLEQLFIWSLVGISAFFLGRRFVRQLRAGLDKNQPLSCGQGCCSCAPTSSCQTDCQPFPTGQKKEKI